MADPGGTLIRTKALKAACQLAQGFIGEEEGPTLVRMYVGAADAWEKAPHWGQAEAALTGVQPAVQRVGEHIQEGPRAAAGYSEDLGLLFTYWGRWAKVIRQGGQRVLLANAVAKLRVAAALLGQTPFSGAHEETGNNACRAAHAAGANTCAKAVDGLKALGEKLFAFPLLTVLAGSAP